MGVDSAERSEKWKVEQQDWEEGGETRSRRTRKENGREAALRQQVSTHTLSNRLIIEEANKQIHK